MVNHNDVAEQRFKASQVAANNLLKKLGMRVEQLDRWATEGLSDAQFVNEVRLKVRYDDQGDVLAIIKTDGEDGKLIAFSSADTIAEALVGLVARVANGSIKWKEDVPYDRRETDG